MFSRDALVPAQPYVEPEKRFSSLSKHLPKNSKAVERRRQTHQRLFSRILEQHAKLAEELKEKERLAKLKESEEKGYTN